MGQVLSSPVCFCLEYGGLSADSFKGLFVQEIKIMNAWLREDVSACSCNARTYRHAYCPCLQCRGLQQTELPSYGTGEKTAYLIRCGRKTLEVTTLRAAWRMILIVIMDHCQALVHEQVLQLRKRLRVMRFLSKDQMKAMTTPSVQSLNPLNLQDFKVRKLP